ncbi:hypothetical protein POVWA2_048290 [Plasmodium ovale wallikeri]|uniref:Uncharacterized protein n=1 Tax=Plasmodium ovale wallikeri TaxID=864142 RepID=A0A1A8ZL46_PLAOA|nr:hypothetical protein POVWA1_039440 [Plasmodium ovale wallikeri]SBT44598.1 hypothetical protein POVWA2_048290 [Plasmodium ovale wallikeri]
MIKRYNHIKLDMRGTKRSRQNDANVTVRSEIAVPTRLCTSCYTTQGTLVKCKNMLSSYHHSAVQWCVEVGDTKINLQKKKKGKGGTPSP